jgi:hypothetical protein
VVAENISANGVIEFLDPWFDPGDQTDTDDLNAVMREHMAAETALLLGRQTFEDFRGYWPLQTDDTTGSTELRLFVYPVLTSRGRNLAPDGMSLQGLTLQEVRPFRSGVVLQTFTL